MSQDGICLQVMAGLSFGDFVLDLANARLRHGHQVVPLTPKAFAVLRHLAERPAQLVAKDELLAAVWPDTHVSDGVLKVSILEVRRALGDDAATPRYIETVLRRGYRFVARVRRVMVTDGSTLGVVGREDVLGELDAALDRAVQGTRQMLFVTGEAGIGKTTVLDTFLGRADGDARVWVARGQSHEQYGVGEAYQPILDAIGRLARDPTRGRIVELLRSHGPTWLAQLPWLVDDPLALRLEVLGTGRDRMLREMAELLEALTREIVLVLALEDLHWSDVSTVTLLTALATRTDPARLLVIGTYRPVELIVTGHPLREVERDLRATGRVCLLPLEFLGESEVTALTQRRFPGGNVSAALAAVVHRRTDGNPLFVVNLLEYLATRGHVVHGDEGWHLTRSLDELERIVPEGLRAMIERQIERCDAEGQLLLETASIVGVEFGANDAAAALEDDPVAIEARCEAIATHTSLLVRQIDDGGAHAARYTFAHALHQQILYDRVLPARRRRLHLRLGEHIETTQGASATEHAGILARHFQLGGDDLRALAYFRQAADTAAQRIAYPEALAHLDQARHLLPALPDPDLRKQTELMIQIARGPCLMMTRGWAAPIVLETFARARHLLGELGDPVHLFPILWGLWAFHAVRGDLATAAGLADECMTMADASGDDGLKFEAHHAQWVTCFFRGDFPACWTHVQAGLALHDPERDGWHVMVYGTDPGVAAHAYAGMVLLALGRIAEAGQFTSQSIALAERVGHPVSKVFAVNFAAWVADVQGDTARCEALACENLERATRLGLELWHAHATCFRGIARAATDLESGIEEHRRGLAALEATGARMGVPSYYVTLAVLVGLRAGRLEEAEEICAQAWRASDETGQGYGRSDIRRVQGELVLAAERTTRGGRPPSARTARRAEAFFREALDIAGTQGARPLEMRAAVSLARLHRTRNELAQAREILGPALRAMPADAGLVEVTEARALYRELGGRLGPLARPTRPC